MWYLCILSLVEEVPMAIRRVNHVVLSVTDLEVSARFYCAVLGLRAVARIEGMVFLRSPADSANHHDLALIANASAEPVDGVPGLFHVAFEVGTVDELEELADRLGSAGALGALLDQGMHLSVYGTDPDGLAVEIIWRVPNADWSYDDELSRGPLDFEAARRRWGGALVTGEAAGVPA
jgi:catechol-2,3-dioxygenase